MRTQRKNRPQKGTKCAKRRKSKTLSSQRGRFCLAPFVPLRGDNSVLLSLIGGTEKDPATKRHKMRKRGKSKTLSTQRGHFSLVPFVPLRGDKVVSLWLSC